MSWKSWTSERKKINIPSVWVLCSRLRMNSSVSIYAPNIGMHFHEVIRKCLVWNLKFQFIIWPSGSVSCLKNNLNTFSSPVDTRDRKGDERSHWFSVHTWDKILNLDCKYHAGEKEEWSTLHLYRFMGLKQRMSKRWRPTASHWAYDWCYNWSWTFILMDSTAGYNQIQMALKNRMPLHFVCQRIFSVIEWCPLAWRIQEQPIKGRCKQSSKTCSTKQSSVM